MKGEWHYFCRFALSVIKVGDTERGAYDLPATASFQKKKNKKPKKWQRHGHQPVATGAGGGGWLLQ